MGVKVAAVRKLEQELGIPPEDVPLDSFKFLTRVHYKVQHAGDAICVLVGAVVLCLWNRFSCFGAPSLHYFSVSALLSNT